MAHKKGEDILFLELPYNLHRCVIVRGCTDDRSKTRQCSVNELYSKVPLNGIGNKPVIDIPGFRIYCGLKAVNVSYGHDYFLSKK